jgi:protease-4
MISPAGLVFTPTRHKKSRAFPLELFGDISEHAVCLDFGGTDMNFKKTVLVIFGAVMPIILIGCISMPTGPRILPLEERVIREGGKEKILVIRIDGVISDSTERDFLGNELDLSMTARVKEELDRAAKDPAIKGILLRINSPGGSVTPCDIIYNEIMRFKKAKGIPVVVEMGDIAASGGVYIASAGDKILAHPTTVTGSIGVIAQFVNAKDLFDKIGLRSETIKSGDKKDIGSPFRVMTPDERALLQDVINSMYERFLSIVLAGRKNLTDAKLRPVADGRIFTAARALEYGLIDSIGYTEDAIALAEKESGVSQAMVVTYSRPGRYVSNIYARAPIENNGTINLININASFLETRYGVRFLFMMTP